MSLQTNTAVRMFGALHTIMKDRGLESTVNMDIPPDGCTACDLAKRLNLPQDKVEAVFINHLVYGLEHIIKPGDRVTFVPTGIPGPHRFLLRIYGAGRQNNH